MKMSPSSGSHSDVPLHECSYNERRIMRDLLQAHRGKLYAAMTQAKADLEFVDDLLERLEEQEDK